MQAGSVVWLEQIIENLTAVGFGIVDQETRVASASTNGPDAVESTTGAMAVESDRGRNPGLCRCGDVGKSGDGGSGADGELQKLPAIEALLHEYWSFLGLLVSCRVKANTLVLDLIA